MQFKCTRVDESYDDHRWRVTPEAVLAVVQAGDVAGFKTYSHAGGGVVGGESKGFTTYLGKRGDNGSGRLGRIYDKRCESQGDVDAVRWEVEWSKLKAPKVFDDLAACRNVDDLATIVALHIGGAFDFPIRDGGKGHLYRCDRHDWWVELVADLGGRVNIRVERKTPAYEAAKSAFRFQYAPLLSVIEEVEGKAGAAEFLRACKEEGLGRQGVRHRRMVIEAEALRRDRVA
jgi:hypothetical protein